MIGMLYIGFFGVYLLLSGWLTDWAARRAKKRGIAGWKWGLPMALVMYHLVFWDWVPTVVAHQYYCSKYGGFTVYKTLEEWKKENPGVAEGLVSEHLPEKYFVKEETNINHSKRRFYLLPDGTELIAHYNIIGEYSFTDIRRDDEISSYWLNMRFALNIFHDDEEFGVGRREDRIVDTKTGEILANYVNFSTRVGAIGLGVDSIRDLKIWMKNDLCEFATDQRQALEFNDFSQSVKNLGAKNEHE